MTSGMYGKWSTGMPSNGSIVDPTACNTVHKKLPGRVVQARAEVECSTLGTSLAEILLLLEYDGKTVFQRRTLRWVPVCWVQVFHTMTGGEPASRARSHLLSLTIQLPS